MLVDVGERQCLLLFVLLLQLEEIKVFPVRRRCDYTFSLALVSAPFEVEFVAQHLWVLQLNRVLHETEDHWLHSFSLHCEDAKDLRNQRVWVL